MQKDIVKKRHTLAHILAAAVKELYGGEVKFGTGPVVENGFYYDMEIPEKISEKDLQKIEEKMKEIIEKNLPIKAEKWEKQKALQFFKENNQPYKQKLVEKHTGEKNEISVYHLGNTFTDLCEGPHVANTDQIDPDSFALTSIAGAYWQADENNSMLTRIYGVAFDSPEQLQTHLKHREEAKERDHRKLGRELDLFTFSDLIGAGLPLYTAKGATIINELYRSLLEISKQYGVQEVKIPHLAKEKLYELSGHAEKFKEELFRVQSHYEQEFVLKPVNCPHHTQIYASQLRSYRDLPIRYIESTPQHRDEKPGEIGGLTRTRSFTVDDGHTFCRVGQIKQEAATIAKIINEFYEGLGMWGNHWVSLSVRDPKSPDKYIGDAGDWEKAETMLQELSDELKLNAARIEGEAAIYGPKLDYMFKDALGNERQLATIQIDFAMPKRFGLEYVNENGEKQTPVMLHRAILGSYERFLAILLEHFNGALPAWLQPVQVAILPISEDQREYTENIANQLAQKMPELRAEIYPAQESLGKRIREAQDQRVPYILIAGGSEQKNNTVNLRLRTEEEIGEISTDEFIQHTQEVIKNRKLKLWK